MSTGANAPQLRMTRVRVRRIFSAVALALITNDIDTVPTANGGGSIVIHK